MRVRLFVLLVVGCVAQSSAKAQEASSGAAAPGGQDTVSAARQERRWSIAVDIGGTSSGPARDIEDAMRAAHLDDASPGFGGAVGHPFSNTGFGAIGFAVSVEARYRISQPWSVGVLFNDTPIGTTLGYRHPFQSLSVDHSVTSVAAMLSARALLPDGSWPGAARCPVAPGRQFGAAAAALEQQFETRIHCASSGSSSCRLAGLSGSDTPVPVRWPRGRRSVRDFRRLGIASDVPAHGRPVQPLVCRRRNRAAFLAESRRRWASLKKHRGDPRIQWTRCFRDL